MHLACYRGRLADSHAMLTKHSRQHLFPSEVPGLSPMLCEDASLTAHISYLASRPYGKKAIPGLSRRENNHRRGIPYPELLRFPVPLFLHLIPFITFALPQLLDP
jgi:hypothetical protein